jgi:hypothetical protein
VQQRAEQGGDGIGGSPEHHGRRITETALELAADPVGAADGAAGRGVTGDEGAVLAQVHHGRGHHGAVAQREHLDIGPVRHRGSDECRAEVHSEVISHAASWEPAPYLVPDTLR